MLVLTQHTIRWAPKIAFIIMPDKLFIDSQSSAFIENNC